MVLFISANKGRVKLSSVQISLVRGRLMVAPINNNVGNSKTLHKTTLSPSANNKTKRSLFLTKMVYGIE